MKLTSPALIFVTMAQVLLCAEVKIIHEIRGDGVLSRVGIADPISFTRTNALLLAELFQRTQGQEHKLSRLALFSTERAAMQFDVGKGSFHSTLDEWRIAQQRPQSCPAIEVLSVGGSLSLRLCDASGSIQSMVVAGKDIFNWHGSSIQPRLAYLSIQRGMYSRSEGPAPDNIRVRLYYAASTLPKLTSARKLIREWSQLLNRPVQLSVQVSGRFPLDGYYPYVNPFLLTNKMSLEEVAREPVLSCYLKPEPYCRLTSRM